MSAHPHSLHLVVAPPHFRADRAESRAGLKASRARLVAADDAARRRMQRDLHQGAHQSFVNSILALKMAREELAAAGATGPGVELVDEALQHAERATAHLREFARDILPGALVWGGLRGGVAALLSRVDLPADMEITADRLPEAVEATAYFVIAEALENAVHHARATRVQVVAVLAGSVLRVDVHDDGVGRTQADGSGLLALSDRVAALNGELRVQRATRAGTLVTATFPLPRPAPAPGR